MINVLICGICGQMGEKVYEAATRAGLNVICGVDNISVSGNFNCPVYYSFDEVNENVDVIIDFSTPDVIDKVLHFAVENKCALVEATTGFTEKQKALIRNASKEIPIFLSVNMSVALNLLSKLSTEVAVALKDFDIEIIDKHHAEKVNAPSNTSLQLADEINQVLGGNMKITCGRSGNSPRKEDEICIHSVRGGSLSGENEVMFIGENETITITHSVQNKVIYADGACRVTKFIYRKPAGLYKMKDYFEVIK